MVHRVKRTPLSKRGKKSSEWAAFARKYPASDHVCRKCSIEGRSTVAHVWHHRGQRSTHPAHITNVVNLVALCVRCHDRVHGDMVGAFVVGWVLRSRVEPGSVDDPWTG